MLQSNTAAAGCLVPDCGGAGGGCLRVVGGAWEALGGVKVKVAKCKG